ncbi:MAG: ribosome biosis GTPase / thiamine phosphate phosphatase [Thermosediminibacterales bacterium]|nr:ribosome biosis GTPase / thiamine phosphate phosphatase [Thermosediminibacterales bacterium]MDK2835435.1 ribosome biosis GTPase / thiamine phosphate phosphatase [Thermosediminibacterales bacterium]
MAVGIITKGFGGFFYVQVENKLIETIPPGRFKKEGINLFVGDKVEIKEKTSGSWVIDKIYPRKNQLLRPPIANIDQTVLVFSLKMPKINLELLDKYLILTEKSNIRAVICLNKMDLLQPKEVEEVVSIYKKAGYAVIHTSAKLKQGITELKEVLKNKISVFAGPSGVGKSTLLNILQPGLKLKTGQLSQKILRGKHTTRHVELIKLNFGGYVADTPGFSSIEMKDIKKEELAYMFPEMKNLIYKCRFRGCLHYSEPDCEIKRAVEAGFISKSRYNHYLKILMELNKYRRR